MKKEQIKITKMLDLIGNEVNMHDEVAYIYLNENGKTSVSVGKVVGFTSKKARLMTENGAINVKNIIKLNRVVVTKTVNKKQIVKKVGLIESLKEVFKR